MKLFNKQTHQNKMFNKINMSPIMFHKINHMASSPIHHHNEENHKEKHNNLELSYKHRR
jgi:hypothetical protein